MGHLTRALLIVAGVVLVVFVAPRLIPLPEVMQNYGFYFEHGDEEYWASRPVQYADSGNCSTCHSDNYIDWQAAAHQDVACETCHGPAQTHVDEVATAPLPEVDPSRELCGKCHDMLVSRPADFPQVDLTQHNPGSACVTCHDPHHPAPFSLGASHTEADEGPAPVADTDEADEADEDSTPAAGTPPLIPHPLAGRDDCLMCHGPNSFKPIPADHAGRGNETCRSCHRSVT